MLKLCRKFFWGNFSINTPVGNYVNLWGTLLTIPLIFPGFPLCHDGIRASSSYHTLGIFCLCLAQSFRKSVPTVWASSLEHPLGRVDCILKVSLSIKMKIPLIKRGHKSFLHMLWNRDRNKLISAIGVYIF